MHALPLPADPSEITPDWLTAALSQGGTLRQGSVETVTWEIIGEDRGFTGVIARLRLQYSGGASQREVGPASLIAKLPTAQRNTPSEYRAAQDRDQAAVHRHYLRCAREVRFYQEIAPLGGIAVPRLYYASADDAAERVVLLLDGLNTTRTGDALQEWSSDDAELIVSAMAEFHARWWMHPDLDIFTWLPRWDSDHGARWERYRQQAEPFLERFGQQIPASISELIERLYDGFGAVLSALDEAPTTIIHADLHLDNVLFNAPGIEPPAILLDWQSVCRGPCVVDFAPVVFSSMANEDDLFHRYHALLVEGGVSHYTLDDLRFHCRLALLRQLAGWVGWLSSVDLGALAGRERALTLAALQDRRFMAALLDHDVGDLLPR